MPVKEICWSQDWDFELQGAVAAIPSRSRKGVINFFGRFVKDVLAEEKRQGVKLQFELRDAEQKAKLVAASQKQNPPKQPR